MSIHMMHVDGIMCTSSVGDKMESWKSNWEIKYEWGIWAAFGIPDVPLVLTYAATCSGSFILTQSFSPYLSRSVQEWRPFWITSPRKFNTKMFEDGISHSKAASRVAGSDFASVKTYFASVILK